MAATDMEQATKGKKKRRTMTKLDQKRQSKKTKPTKPLKRWAKFLTRVAGDDTLSEIFTRLPNARDALNCAAVCTRWHSFICHPNFYADFKRRRIDSAPAFTILFRAIEYDFRHRWLHGEFFSAESAILHAQLAPLSLRNSAKKLRYLNFLPRHSKVMSSWKDLLLVRLPAPHNLLCICNPLTRQRVPLPDPRGIVDPTTGTVFDAEARRCNGFLVCDESHIYQCGLLKAYTVALVICKCFSENQFCLDVAVFRSETGKWDAHSVRFPLDMEAYWEPRFSFATSEGILYLPMIKDVLCVKISAFDPRDVMGSYFEIGLPQGFQSSEVRTTRFGVLKGKMRVWQTCVEKMTQKFVLKVWQQNGKSEDWVSVIDVKLETLGYYNSINSLSDATTLIFDPNNDNAFFFVNPCKSNLRHYDIRTGRYRKIHYSGFVYWDSCSINFTLEHPHWPTQIPLLNQTKYDIKG